MRTQRTAVALCAVSVLAAVTYCIFKYENPVYIAPTLAAIALAFSILEFVHRSWGKKEDDKQGTAGTPEQAEAAADWLAGAVAGSWRKEAAARRIVAPAPVSVRWRWAGGLRPREAEQPSAAGAGPPSLPGSEETGHILTSGVVTKLHDELYARLPRGRLVLTGGPGSGKTGAMILLLLEALARREELAPSVRAKVPVPVLLPLGGWDPVSVPLSEWAVSVLNRDYRALQAPRYGTGAASALISSCRVALFLDGLDEMPGSLRVAALRRLNAEAPGLRIVMASRPAEYAEAVRKAPLDSSAVIELCPVRPAAAARFLLREQPGSNRAEWEKVTGYITDNPDSAAAKALDSPLELTMARDAYATGDPTAIIDSARFPTEDTITAHLTGQFLARAFPDPRARRWLGQLARHLDGRDGDGSHDLEWWRLGGLLRPATRIMAIALATFVIGTIVGLIIEVPADLSVPPPAGLRYLTVLDRLLLDLGSGLLDGLLTCAVFGLGSAIVMIYGKTSFGPSQVPLRLRGPRAMARALRGQNHTVRAASGFLIGLAGGLGYTIIEVLMSKMLYGVRVLSAEIIQEALVTAAFFGALFGLTAGVIFVFVSALEEPSDTGSAATPLSLLAESRSRTLLLAAIFAPLTTIIIAAGGWIAAGPLRGLLTLGPSHWSLPDALVLGGMVGFSATIAYGPAFTAWGQWVVLARIMLPLTGKLPWRLPGFLDDAYRRGVLRQAGGVYQFRHLTLQQYLSRESRNGAGEVMECEG